MFGPRKCKNYRINQDLSAAYREFAEYKSIDYEKEEQRADKDWKGNFLPYIPTILPNSLPPLPPALEKMIESAWQEIQVSAAAKAAGRSGLQSGAHRTTAPRASSMPDPAYKKISTPATRQAGPIFNIQSSMAPHLKKSFAQDWAHHEKIPRVLAYAFRGDSRNPDLIKLAGGFSPPISRTDDWYIKTTVYPQFRDYLEDNFGLDISETEMKALIGKTFGAALKQQFLHYGVWRATIERESLHLGRMVAFEALKGFISTTKAVTVAKAYAGTKGGWVYVMYVDGGYHLPAKGNDTWTTIFGEQEIAYPGAIPWAMVQGFRQVGSDGMFKGNIFLRESFDQLEKDSALTVLKLLSGKKQL
jgi:hypothetical protein